MMSKPPEDLDIINDFHDFYDKACEYEELDISEDLEKEACGDRYSEWKLIGQGGMKNVYQVYDHKTSRHVALAILNDPKNSFKKDLFLREAKLTALLDHPNIITLHDLGLDEEGVPFFTMELRSHNSLAKVISSIKNKDSDEYSIQYRLELFLRVCDAMAYAHSKNIIHLDLKPDNIQIGLYGEVQICDWGLGKIIGECEEIHAAQDDELYDYLGDKTLFGSVKGTPGFMAPEQIQNGQKDFRTDVYSLACILYGLLCGTYPNSASDKEQLNANINGEFTAPYLRNAQISKSLSAVCEKGLQLNPDDRYQTCLHLQQDIRSFLDGFATSAEEASFIKQSQLFFQRNRAVCISVFSAFFIIMIGTLIFVDRLNKSREIAELEERKTKQINAQLNKTIESYESERFWTNMILNRQPGVAVLVSYLYTDTKVYVEPLNAVKKARTILDRLIEENPNYTKAYVQHGITALLMQDFNLAYNDFNKSDFEVEDLHQYLKNNSPFNEKLTYAEMAKFIKKFGTSNRDYRRRLVMKLLMVDYYLRENIDEHVKLVMINLKNHNPKWDENNYKYSPENGGKLKLYGEGLERLTIRITPERSPLHDIADSISLLESLPVAELDLSESSLVNR